LDALAVLLFTQHVDLGYLDTLAVRIRLACQLDRVACMLFLILVDAGAGTWFGGGAYGHLVGNLRSAGYTPEEVDLILVTHLHSDHVGGLTSDDGKRVFPKADVYVAKAESDFWLSSEIAAKAPKDAQPFFQSAQAIAAPYIKVGKWHTFSGSEPIVDGMQLVPLHGHTPGHTRYEFSSREQKTLFWGDTIHAQRFQNFILPRKRCSQSYWP
jgi:glyoxylase-like metal-dependent hydrolase (beta-lactamase superfamily II)